MKFKVLTGLLFGLGMVSGPLAATAQSLDDGCRSILSATPMTMIVPNNPGGGYDTYARAFAPVLGDVIGTKVRVTNMPGGGGLLATQTVAEQSADELLLMIDDFTDLAGNLYDGRFDVDLDDMAPLGIVLSEPRVWLTKPGMDVSTLFDGNLVASSPTLDSSVIDLGLVARALNIDLKVVAGYDGSSEQAAAILRGETDVTGQSISSGIRNSKNGDLDVALVIASERSSRLPEAPSLAELVEGLPTTDNQDERNEAAQLAISLGTAHRGIATASTLNDERMNCIRAATSIAVTDPAFAKAAEDQGRIVDPRAADEAIAIFEAIGPAWAKIGPLAEQVMEEMRP